MLLLCEQLNKHQQQCTPALVYRKLNYRFITHPPLPSRGDSVANHSARSTPARRSATNADTYYLTLQYNQVRLNMPPPPFEGVGGNHSTSVDVVLNVLLSPLSFTRTRRIPHERWLFLLYRRSTDYRLPFCLSLDPGCTHPTRLSMYV